MNHNITCINKCCVYNIYTNKHHTFNPGDFLYAKIIFCKTDSHPEFMYKVTSVPYEDEDQYKFVLSETMLVKNFKFDGLLKYRKVKTHKRFNVYPLHVYDIQTGPKEVNGAPKMNIEFKCKAKCRLYDIFSRRYRTYKLDNCEMASISIIEINKDKDDVYQVQTIPYYCEPEYCYFVPKSVLFKHFDIKEIGIIK